MFLTVEWGKRYRIEIFLAWPDVQKAILFAMLEIVSVYDADFCIHIINAQIMALKMQQFWCNGLDPTISLLEPISQKFCKKKNTIPVPSSILIALLLITAWTHI